MKRYAIVRVDGTTFCPSTVEGKDIDDFVCSDKSCKNCRYGDTKEQMVKKVAQALELCMNKGYRTITSEEYAKFIVEFLGVE